MTLAEKLQDRKREILKITLRYGAYDVRVFGSVARGSSNRGSDLDLLVKMRAGSSLLDIIAIKQEIEDLLSVRVDVVTEQALSPYLRQAVIQEAVAL